MSTPAVQMLCMAVVAFFAGCNSSSNHERQEYDYVPLKEYSYKLVTIEPGTELELLAFSGGKSDDKDEVLYYQFIVLNRSTGDTIRLLTPMIFVDDAEKGINKTYSAPLQYDPSKGITTAYYEAKDSTQNLLLQSDKIVDGDKIDTSGETISSLMNHISSKELVVINKSMPIFENPDYKTAIGILGFKKIPW